MHDYQISQLTECSSPAVHESTRSIPASLGGIERSRERQRLYKEEDKKLWYGRITDEERSEARLIQRERNLARSIYSDGNIAARLKIPVAVLIERPELLETARTLLIIQHKLKKLKLNAPESN